uniref:Helitron helicase-like domain-containing protein n=1 Tax=Lactuca sativa TaxID=4236 RepID=A0A9R1XL28_LACSA|nr:hypothetical protein LSAT_V11C400164370 [Lactuca sativa]
MVTIIHNSSSIKLPRGKHQLKRKTPDISSIPVFDLTLDEESNHDHIVEDKFRDISKDYLDHGDEIVICHAKLWLDELLRGRKRQYVLFPMLWLHKKAPSSYKILYRSVDSKSKHFMKNIRHYNLNLHPREAKLIHPSTQSTHHTYSDLAVKIIIVWEVFYLQIDKPTSASTSSARSYDLQIIEFLKVMLDSNNVLVKSYRMVRDSLHENPDANLKLRLIGKREQDGRTYNLPTSSEVAALIVGDISDSIEKRDIIVETSLKRINELHPSYLALQYPLLFPYGDDGYRVDILHRGITSSSNSKHPTYTMIEFFAYRIQDRDKSFSLLLNAKRLFQQFLVDGYTMIESERLFFIRKQQKILRCESYENLRNHQSCGSTNISNVGQRVILPSSFTGSARYMMQHYLDAMSLCKWFGYSDFFHNLYVFLKDTPLHPKDRPDILCRLFKMKLDAFIKDLREKKFLASGLPHSHICLFMHSNCKLPTVEYIDLSISTEILNINEDP